MSAAAPLRETRVNEWDRIRCRAEKLRSMHARAVEDAARRLHDLRYEEWEDTILTVAVLGAAIAVSRFDAALGVALFAGGCLMAFRALRATLTRWSLVELLTSERDAYTIPEIRTHAQKAASKANRRQLAQSIRALLADPSYAEPDRVSACAEELEQLAAGLEDLELDFDPACAIACTRLLTDAVASPLFNAALPAEDARAALLRIEAGLVALEVPQGDPAAPTT
jgi:hypothetical protein